jgi:hypothetical protein
MIALSVIKASSNLWLPSSSLLHAPLCRWLPGLVTCSNHTTSGIQEFESGRLQ